MSRTIRTFIVRPDGVRVETTNCFWCAGQDWVCAACVAKADAKKNPTVRKDSTDARQP